MPKTIKEIIESLAMAITHSQQGSYDVNEMFVKQSLSSLLDEIGKRFPGDTISDKGFNECLELCNRVLSDLRKELN